MHNYGDKIYLGIDLGTSSVGWAVTDENYCIRRAKGKDLWGVRLFDEAKPSVRRKLIKSIRDFLSVLRKANITLKIEVKIIIKDMQFLMMIIIRMRIFIKSILPCFILEND